MKIKKSKFAKLLSLALPIAAISVVAPAVLTSCGTTSSTDTPSNGGGTGGDTGGTTTPMTYAATWDTNKTISGVTFDTISKEPTITLSDTAFNQTGITKNSKFADIVKSLTPTKTSSAKSSETREGERDSSEAVTATMYSVLKGAIINVDKYNVALKIDPNTISFDYTNDEIGNTVTGEFNLTPIKSNEGSNTTLKFVINNFDDSYNGDTTDSSKQLTWNVTAIANAFKADGEAANTLPDVTPTNNGAAAVIDLKDSKIGLGKVMDDLCNDDSSITGYELKKFIEGNTNDYDIANADISNWAPNVLGTMVFTRIVIKNNDTTKENAVMYIVYTGFTKDAGNGAWNRNIPYFSDDASKDIWDLAYNNPVIDLAKIDGMNIDSDTKITNKSTSQDIAKNIDKIRNCIAKNYIIGFEGNFKISNTNQNNQIGKFKADGTFEKISDLQVQNQKSIVSKKDAIKETSSESSSSDSLLKNNDNVIFIQFVIQTEENKTTSAAINNDAKGIYKGFYIIGYSTDSAS